MWQAMSDQATYELRDEASRAFGQWHFGPCADGAMWATPGARQPGETALLGLIAMLDSGENHRSGQRAERPGEADIVLHLADIRSLAPGWRQLAGSLLNFTRRLGVPCRLITLANRPALVPSFCSGTDTQAGPALHECLVSTSPSGV